MISCTVEHRPLGITKRSVSQRVTLSSSLLGEKPRFCSADESKESSSELSCSPSSPPSIVGVIVPQIDLGPEEAEVIPLSSSSSFTRRSLAGSCSVSVVVIVSVCLFSTEGELFACLLGVAFWRGIFLSIKFPFWRLKCPTVCECVCVAFSFSLCESQPVTRLGPGTIKFDHHTDQALATLRRAVSVVAQATVAVRTRSGTSRSSPPPHTDKPRLGSVASGSSH